MTENEKLREMLSEAAPCIDRSAAGCLTTKTLREVKPGECSCVACDIEKVLQQPPVPCPTCDVSKAFHDVAVAERNLFRVQRDSAIQDLKRLQEMKPIGTYSMDWNHEQERIQWKEKYEELCDDLRLHKEERIRLRSENLRLSQETEKLRNALASVSLDEYESTSTASEKVHRHARIAREVLHGKKEA